MSHVHDLTLCESLRKVLRNMLVLTPERLMVTLGDLHVGEVLHQRQQLLLEQLATDRRVIVPVVAVRGLGSVDVPFVRRVTRLDHLAISLSALDTTVPPVSRE